MRSVLGICAATMLLGGVAFAQDYNGRYDANPAPAFVHAGGVPIKEQRLLFNQVKLMDQRFRVCDGRAPYRVRTRHTAKDIAAAVVTLGIWTPTHAFVRC